MKQQQNRGHSAVDFSSVDGDQKFPRPEASGMISKTQQIRRVVSKTMNFYLV
jgi:hypothetical protein